MSYQRRVRRRQRSGSGLVLFIATLALVFMAAAAGGVIYIDSLAAKAPELSELRPADQGNISTVYAAGGERLGFIQGDILRTPVNASRMPEIMRQTTVATEDRRFYKHDGVDYTGVARAAVKNLESGGSGQGGSTITMQLIRNLYNAGREKTLERKVREAKLATQLEKRNPGRAGKLWILTQYLNSVPYGTVGGQTAIGVEAASRVFFNKPARKLKLREAALLAGLPQAPSEYNPFDNPKLAKQRRNEVLGKMAEQGYITRSLARKTMRRGLGVKSNRYYQKRREGYLFDYVYNELVRRYGLAAVRRGGLKVYTTVSLDLQKAARRAMADNLSAGGPSAALVSMDPQGGSIKAMASSRSYDQSNFNLAAQGKRQPGSTFKTMVLMAALRKGMDINKTTYDSKPLNFFDRKTGAKIEVKTYDNSYMGRTSVFEALIKSDNSVFQQLDLDVTPEAVRRAAYDMGIESKLDAYPAEGLGGLKRGVSPLEMARAYSTISNGGFRVRPTAIRKIVFPDGRVVKNSKQRRVKVFSDGMTHEAVKALEANVQRGTGTRADLGCPTAGKTGTTNNATDAWFAGFTSSLSTVTWLGYPNAAQSMGNMAGGMTPAQIFRDFMAEAMQGRPCRQFKSPRSPFRAKPFQGRFASGQADTGPLSPEDRLQN